MGFTKRQFVDAAFEEIGFASYEFDIPTEKQQYAMRRLDTMMADWNARGIRLGYPIPSSPNDSDLDEATTVPDSANEAIITNLAVKIAPGLGKTLAPETKIAAKNALNTLMARAAMPSEMQFPGSLPYGAGNKPFRTEQVFFPVPVDPLTTGPDSELEF